MVSELVEEREADLGRNEEGKSNCARSGKRNAGEARRSGKIALFGHRKLYPLRVRVQWL